MTNIDTFPGHSASTAGAPPAGARVPMAGALRRILVLDAVATAGAGLLLVAGAGLLAPLLGLPVALQRGTGASFVVFAALVALAVRARSVPRGIVLAVAGYNALWAAESVGALGLGWLQPTALGAAFVLAQAGLVAVFAALEWRAARG